MNKFVKFKALTDCLTCLLLVKTFNHATFPFSRERKCNSDSHSCVSCLHGCGYEQTAKPNCVSPQFVPSPSCCSCSENTILLELSVRNHSTCPFSLGLHGQRFESNFCDSSQVTNASWKCTIHKTACYKFYWQKVWACSAAYDRKINALQEFTHCFSLSFPNIKAGQFKLEIRRIGAQRTISFHSLHKESAMLSFHQKRRGSPARCHQLFQTKFLTGYAWQGSINKLI